MLKSERGPLMNEVSKVDNNGKVAAAVSDAVTEVKLNLLIDKMEKSETRQENMSTGMQKGFTEFRKEFSDLRVDIAGLKVKSGVWGAAAGFIPASMAILYVVLKG